uniref:Uncharacterized protein n=1 Tax=Cacopsylla melanoneura TaxID=428564 RepID=A0A8D8RA85_9HEMI
MNPVLIVLMSSKMLLGTLCAENNTEEIKGNEDVQQYRTFRNFDPQETTTTVKRQYEKLGNTNLLHVQLGISSNATYGQDLEATPSIISKTYPPPNDIGIEHLFSSERVDLNTTNIITDTKSSKSLMSNLEVSKDLPSPNICTNNNSYILPNSNNYSTSNKSDDLCNPIEYTTNKSHGADDLVNEYVSINKSDQIPIKHRPHDLKPNMIYTKKRVRPNPNKKRPSFNTTKKDVGMNNMTYNMASDSQLYFVKSLMDPGRDPKKKLTVEDVKKVNILLALYTTLCVAVYVVNVVICIVLAILKD